MLSRSLSKTDHFTLALHTLKEAYPELVPQKVQTQSNISSAMIKLICFSFQGMGIVSVKFRVS